MLKKKKKLNRKTLVPAAKILVYIVWHDKELNIFRFWSVFWQNKNLEENDLGQCWHSGVVKGTQKSYLSKSSSSSSSS